MNEVIEFTADRDHAAWPYCAAYTAGTTLYAIKHHDRYFKWVYIHRDMAEMVANRVVCDYNPSNWVALLDNTCPSDKRP